MPTIGEAFLLGFEASTWGMVIAPANLPAAVLARLHADVVAAVRRPDVVARHSALGAEVVTSNPDETRSFVQAELEKWGVAARAAGVQPQNAG